MTDDLQLYQTILFTQRPWMDTSTSEAKYRELLHSTRPEDFAHQPLYELSFLKPLTPKTKYFQIIIHNEAVSFLNRMHHVIDHAINDNEKKYHIHVALGKKLPALFNETQRIIRSHQFNFSLLNDVSVDKKVIENVFIVQFLKYRLIGLYLEIQDYFHEFVTEDILSEGQIHSLWFSEKPPEIAIIVKSNTSKMEVSKLSEEEIKFVPIKADFRETKDGILTYKELIKDASKFAQFEIILFDEGLIDKKYSFCKKRGNVGDMAAAYRVSIIKRYFNPFLHPGKKKITDLQIKNFLNYRYKVDIDKEFRNFRNSTLLEDYLIKKPWLSLIPPC